MTVRRGRAGRVCPSSPRLADGSAVDGERPDRGRVEVELQHPSLHGEDVFDERGAVPTMDGSDSFFLLTRGVGRCDHDLLLHGRARKRLPGVFARSNSVWTLCEWSACSQLDFFETMSAYRCAT